MSKKTISNPVIDTVEPNLTSKSKVDKKKTPKNSPPKKNPDNNDKKYKTAIIIVEEENDITEKLENIKIIQTVEIIEETPIEESIPNNIIPHVGEDKTIPEKFTITYKIAFNNMNSIDNITKHITPVISKLISITGGSNHGKEFKKINTSNFTITMRKNITEDETDKLENIVKNGFAITFTYTHEMGSDDGTKNIGCGNSPHVQAYMITSIPTRPLRVKTEINKIVGREINATILISRGTSWQNYKYIQKELKDHPEFKHRLYGEPILKPGRTVEANTRHDFSRGLQEGTITLDTIKQNNLEHYVSNEQYYIRYMSIIKEKAIKPPPFICWFSGKTGTGKSRSGAKLAELLNMKVYNAGAHNGFWNVYNDEDLSIYDDYRSSGIYFSTLLNVTDRNGCWIDVKNGRTFYKPYIQIYTSPDGVESAKTNDMKEFNSLDSRFEQLLRRIHCMLEFKIEGLKDKEIPHEEDVLKALNIATNKTLRMFKYHLIETGFENLLQLYPILTDLEPLPYNRIVTVATPGKKVSVEDVVYKI